jgi:hypothetical protein
LLLFLLLRRLASKVARADRSGGSANETAQTKPGKHMLNMVVWYFVGVARADEVEALLKRPDNRGVKIAAREAFKSTEL